MRKLILLTGATALALTFGLSGVASANHGQVVQTTDGTITPDALPSSGYANANLRVITSVRDAGDAAACASANPPDTCTTPPKASQAYVDFDKNIRFNWNSAGKCARQSIAGDTTAVARATCPNAIIGFGQAIARGGIVGDPVAPGFIDATVTAFNDTQPNTIILHVDIGGVGINLIGTLVNSPLAGFDKRLNVPVPNTGNALTRFDVTINRAGYVQATCPDSPINFRGLFEYAHDRGDEGGGVPIYPASAIGASTDPCIPTCAGSAATHVGTNGADTITGTNGHDVVVARFGHDRIFTRAGVDRIFGEQGADRAFGGGGRDFFFGQQGFDRFFGGAGGDRAFGGGQLDRLFGGAGSDRLIGQGGHDRLFGNAGFDFLKGGAGRDRLFGGAGRDRILGLGGRPDRCFGGAGADRGGRGCELRVSIP